MNIEGIPMNDVVIVTTWQREELLWLCLEAIRRDDPSIPISVYSDRAQNSADLRKACATFDANLRIQIPHSNYGNSFNLLSACSAMTALDYEIIHLIEDDTIIHKGYLAWAREELTNGFVYDVSPKFYAAVCGRIPSPHIPNWYESPCASWNAACLRTALGHIVPEYFSGDVKQMLKALDETMFPNSKYKRGGSEQDGYFLRCIEHHGWKTLFPPKPLATHAGGWGYNSHRKRPEGTFEERIEWCRKMLTNKEMRKGFFGSSITDREMAAWDGKTI